MSDHINHDRCRFLGSAAVTIAAAQLGMIDSTDAPFRDRDPVDAAAHPRRDGELRSLDRATGWLNSRPLTAAVLRGKAVLIEFWTYSCIKWLRQLPYVRAWAERYTDYGLAVIGVHSPEFGFEKNLENVRRAAKA